MENFGAREIVVLIALVAGWVLNELSGSFRRSEDTRRRLSRALSTSLRLTHIFSTLNQTHQYFRSVSDDPVHLERFRSRAVLNFVESTDLLKSEIDEIVDVYREQFPLDAATASFVRDSIAKVGRISLDANSRDGKHYRAIADGMNNMFALSIGTLTKMSRQLAARIGPITYLRVRFPAKKKPSTEAVDALVGAASSADAALRELLSRSESKPDK